MVEQRPAGALAGAPAGGGARLRSGRGFGLGIGRCLAGHFRSDTLPRATVTLIEDLDSPGSW